MYSLLARVHAIDPLKDHFEHHVAGVATKIITDRAQEAAQVFIFTFRAVLTPLGPSSLHRPYSPRLQKILKYC